MAGQLRAIRQRIRGVQSIAKITRAQELIAASRIIKAQQRVRDAGAYAREITQAVEAVVSQSSQIDHPLVREPENSQRAAILILSSDRGFAGGYNSNVMREAQGLRARLRERGVEPVTYVSGTKGITWHRFRGVETAGSWTRLLRDAPARQRRGDHRDPVRGVQHARPRTAGWTRSTSSTPSSCRC